MKNLSNRIILSLLALLALAVPIVGIFVDFGGGTDDAAGEMIGQITPGFEPSDRSFGISPSEEAEPWLFVLQILIGLILFAIALYALNKNHKREQR
ncbi:hypothetical protein HQ45_05880 [Porphyromonas crevioricanis]|uniref:Cobalt transport protein CbiN n=2 Tax=Porphyromonas crevioricanis TaxID=393921 RepID=A0A0A2FJN3_9PORP|nr:energy-coupling factor ABC transporter substrate-binding protein [Porphyromonas crevioricanis]KGN90307.1 hypothetical protein HQ45_05880 [Porphyromonas crevioricanis]KGN95353.1 hypothetical protein HQ38_03455 [Porphyromonas crevioricanis]SJZ59437.1 ABC-type cobalt transport system, substrate-binding protein [Porphyromonas crevioricanis]SQH72743.1 cobalt transport protein CbiN [Porphyromonas crevioricanis]GAD05608.1 hypothetical protein PORCRE_1313 [Porphyromonas crevioricanis JCM 15906]